MPARPTNRSAILKDDFLNTCPKTNQTPTIGNRLVQGEVIEKFTQHNRLSDMSNIYMYSKDGTWCTVIILPVTLICFIA